MAHRGVDIPPAADEPAHPLATPSVTPSPAPEERGWSRLLDPQLIAIGLAGGILSGLLGVGGGVVMVPLLVLWAGYAQRDAHALSLGAIIPISVAGIATYGIAGEVRVWDALALAIGAVAGARVGAGLLARLDDDVLKLAFGVFLIGVAVLMGLKA